jgi:hypothetical protein
MPSTRTAQRFSDRLLVQRLNGWMIKLRSSRLLGPLITKHLTLVTYTGRRSGRTFTLPVAYRRSDNTVTIGVQMADRKGWWRNFLGDGGPLSLELDGTQRTGHAVARPDGRSNAVVTVRLDEIPTTQ